MLEGKGEIKETDMPVKMQSHAASQALDLFDVFDSLSLLLPTSRRYFYIII